MGPLTAQAGPVANGAPPAADTPARPIPWDRRNEIGIWKALGQTISEVISRPTAFFSRVRYDTDDGSVLYLVMVLVLPAALSGAISWLMSSPEQTRALLDQLAPNLPPQVRQYSEYAKSAAGTGHTFGGFIEAIVTEPIEALAFVMISAVLAHVVLMILGSAKGGWTATFRVVAFAATPCLLLPIPFCCGDLIGYTWLAALEIIGLAKAHQTTVGRSTVAVVGPELTCVICCSTAVALVASSLMKGFMG